MPRSIKFQVMSPLFLRLLDTEVVRNIEVMVTLVLRSASEIVHAVGRTHTMPKPKATNSITLDRFPICRRTMGGIGKINTSTSVKMFITA